MYIGIFYCDKKIFLTNIDMVLISKTYLPLWGPFLDDFQGSSLQQPKRVLVQPARNGWKPCLSHPTPPCPCARRGPSPLGLQKKTEGWLQSCAPSPKRAEGRLGWREKILERFRIVRSRIFQKRLKKEAPGQGGLG